MKTILISLTATILSFASCASAFESKPKQSTPTDSVWVQVASTDDDVYSIRKGSFEITNTKAGTPIAVVVVQNTEIKTGNVSYRQKYVAKSDCLNGLGKIVSLDTSGQYLYENDFVSGGTSIASSVASLICSIYNDELKKQSDKSI